MTVDYSLDSVEAFLKISPVIADDEATYKCEITYLEVYDNCEVVQIVRLKTLQVPESVKVYGRDHIPLSNSTVLGPKGEGDEVDLICEASGGKPIPKVKWYNGTTEIQRAEYSIRDAGAGFGTGLSKLQLTLTRGDLLSRFECRVESEALPEPIISWIQIDVHVRPSDISLTGVEKYVVQGTNVNLECIVRGARPAATIRWANGTYDIDEEDVATTQTRESDGTFTTISSLQFKASHWENGKTIFCFAENEVMQKNAEPEIQASLILDVRYPPVITVKPLNVTVNESTDSNVTSVFLQCVYFANPQELKGALWIKDGRNMTLNDTNKYVGGTTVNPPLYINNVNRDDMGEYSCSLRNEIGADTSEDSIYLNVLYPPAVEVIMDPPTPLKAIDKSDAMLMCNVTNGNPSNLQKVRWFLDEKLMKEVPECNYTINKNGGEFCGLEPNLLNLTKVTEHYAGNYSCQGQNVAGWGPISEPRELIVYYPPSPAQLRYYPSKVVKGASVTLQCKVDHPGRPENLTYLWYRGSHQMAEIRTWNFTLKSVRVEERSNFTCIAVNEGGQSEPASVFINVNAPPSFITPLQKYQGVLYNSKQINLTCRVECFPECAIVWYKNGAKLDIGRNPLYNVETQIIPADVQKNDFESIESTLVWNLTAWPGGMLDKSSPNSNYTCAATSNKIGPGINSTIEIAVDYPPEEVTVSPHIVKVIELNRPDPVRCHGKGHPTLSYEWKKNLTSDSITHTEDLNLGPLTREDSGRYICEASNKHGKITAEVFFDVLYAPVCAITPTVKDGSSALVCTAHANPQEVTFVWKVREGNETFVETNNIQSEGLRSYLILDSSIDAFRTYYCYANNSVDKGPPCHKDVPGNLPWWKQLNKERLIIIIAALVAIVIVVIIICIIIIMLCRRKRAETKYNNTLEMEERENNGINCPKRTDQSKWPLRPGLLIQINKMNNVNISQLRSYKTASISRRGVLSKYKRNKSKVCAKLTKLKGCFSQNSDKERLPSGIIESPGGVVTFRKVQAIRREPPPTRPTVTACRKRKFPGAAPNLSSTEDKARLGAAPPRDYAADPMTDSEKQFYENLPFHGMQNPPNKPVSVIAPFKQVSNAQSSTSSSTTHVYPKTLPQNISLSLTQTKENKAVIRNQSFHGFNNVQRPSQPSFNISGNINNAYSFSQMSLQSCPSRSFQYLPVNSRQISRNNSLCETVSLNRSINSNMLHPPNLRVFSGNTSSTTSPQTNRIIGRRSFHHQPESQRVSGRNEVQIIRRTASGIIMPEQSEVVSKDAETVLPTEQRILVNTEKAIQSPISTQTNTVELNATKSDQNLQNTKNFERSNSTSDQKVPNKIMNRMRASNRRLATIAEKRFGSLDIRKHRCYSPTFYSMRCKKHAKKRPIIVALPKKCFSELALAKEPSDKFENLTDSIQIMEENTSGDQTVAEEMPQPAPRCRKHSKEIVYANINKYLSKSGDGKVNNGDVLTKAELHLQTTDRVDGITTDKTKNNDSLNTSKGTDGVSKQSLDQQMMNTISLSSKSTPQKPTISSHALKNSPILKVSPNFIKPMNESPKGALSRQLQAKIKSSPLLNSSITSAQSTQSSPNVVKQTDQNSPNIIECKKIKMSDDELKNDEHCSNVPSMPLLNPQNIRSPNQSNMNAQNAFYTLTNSHFKQLDTVAPPQYSATIPHPKHANKLLPKSLFQEQLPKTKSFSSKSKTRKHHFQIPLQKCHSFKFQTAESYFQPIKNAHEENLMKNGYMSDYPESTTSHHHSRHHKRDKHKKAKGPLVVRRPSDYHFQENIQSSVQLQYPQPLLGGNMIECTNANGVVYADLDMPGSNSRKSGSHGKSKSSKNGPSATEYATLQFNEVRQEIDV